MWEIPAVVEPFKPRVGKALRGTRRLPWQAHLILPTPHDNRLARDRARHAVAATGLCDGIPFGLQELGDAVVHHSNADSVAHTMNALTHPNTSAGIAM